jgi:hypothetical protein
MQALFRRNAELHALLGIVTINRFRYGMKREKKFAAQ